MRNRIFLLVAIFSFVLLPSCTQTTAPPIDNPGGVFKGALVLMDTTGGTPIYGRIYLVRTDTINIAGSWSLNFESGQQGGKLAGNIVDSMITVNLNPDLVDANTYLVGTLRGATIEGRWFFDGVMGPIYRGTFIATSD